MSSPRVTIGLPVYNGAATMGLAIDSLLAQSFTDFELLISDNASTDDTRLIAERYAAQDERVRYVRQTVNLGGNGNYTFVARNARGELLKWSSASDWCAPTFIERCVEALDRDPTAVLAAPRARLFQGRLDEAEDYGDDLVILEEQPYDRLRAMLQRMRLNNSFNGVIRLSALRQTRIVEPYLLADIVLMGHLALLGKYLLVDEPLFCRRMEIATSTALQAPEERLRHHYPAATARTLLQVWKQHLGWFRAGWSAPMPAGERLRVLGFMTRRAIWDRGALFGDLVSAARYAMQPHDEGRPAAQGSSVQ